MHLKTKISKRISRQICKLLYYIPDIEIKNSLSENVKTTTTKII